MGGVPSSNSNYFLLRNDRPPLTIGGDVQNRDVDALSLPDTYSLYSRVDVTLCPIRPNNPLTANLMPMCMDSLFVRNPLVQWTPIVYSLVAPSPYPLVTRSHSLQRRRRKRRRTRRRMMGQGTWVCPLRRKRPLTPLSSWTKRQNRRLWGTRGKRCDRAPRCWGIYASFLPHTETVPCVCYSLRS